MTGRGRIRRTVTLRWLVAVAAPRKQDHECIAFIPQKALRRGCGGCELLLGTCHHRGHALEHIVTKHEMMKVRSGRMPPGPSPRAHMHRVHVKNGTRPAAPRPRA